MNTKKLFMFLAAMLLSNASAFAQSDNSEPLKGDVNGDGKVDAADITAVIKIMKDAGGTAGEKTYYWYVGQTDPSTMTNISPIVTDNSSPGWRLIGTTLPTYNSSNMLWNGVENSISFGSRIYSYIAVPYKPLQMYDSDGDDGMFYSIQNNGNSVDINGVSYYVYKSDYKTGTFEMNIYNK